MYSEDSRSVRRSAPPPSSVKSSAVSRRSRPASSGVNGSHQVVLPSYQHNVSASLARSLSEEMARRAGRPPFDPSPGPSSATPSVPLTLPQQKRRVKQRSPYSMYAPQRARPLRSAAAAGHSFLHERGSVEADLPPALRVILNDIGFSSPPAPGRNHQLESPAPWTASVHAETDSDMGFVAVQRPQFHYRPMAPPVGDAMNYGISSAYRTPPPLSAQKQSFFAVGSQTKIPSSSDSSSYSDANSGSETFFDRTATRNAGGTHGAERGCVPYHSSSSSTSSSSSSSSHPSSADARENRPGRVGGLSEAAQPRGGDEPFFDGNSDAALLSHLAKAIGGGGAGAEGAVPVQEQVARCSARPPVPHRHPITGALLSLPPHRQDSPNTSSLSTSALAQRVLQAWRPGAEGIADALGQAQDGSKGGLVWPHEVQHQPHPPPGRAQRRGEPNGFSAVYRVSQAAVRPAIPGLYSRGRGGRRGESSGPELFLALTPTSRRCVCCDVAMPQQLHDVVDMYGQPHRQHDCVKPLAAAVTRSRSRKSAASASPPLSPAPAVELQQCAPARHNDPEGEYVLANNGVAAAALTPSPPVTSAAADARRTGRHRRRPHQRRSPSTPETLASEESTIQSITKGVLEELMKTPLLASAFAAVKQTERGSSPIQSDEPPTPSLTSQPRSSHEQCTPMANEAPPPLTCLPCPADSEAPPMPSEPTPCEETHSPVMLATTVNPATASATATSATALTPSVKVGSNSATPPPRHPVTPPSGTGGLATSKIQGGGNPSEETRETPPDTRVSRRPPLPPLRHHMAASSSPVSTSLSSPLASSSSSSSSLSSSARSFLVRAERQIETVNHLSGAGEAAPDGPNAEHSVSADVTAVVGTCEEEADALSPVDGEKAHTPSDDAPSTPHSPACADVADGVAEGVSLPTVVVEEAAVLSAKETALATSPVYSIAPTMQPPPSAVEDTTAEPVATSALMASSPAGSLRQSPDTLPVSADASEVASVNVAAPRELAMSGSASFVPPALALNMVVMSCPSTTLGLPTDELSSDSPRQSSSRASSSGAAVTAAMIDGFWRGQRVLLHSMEHHRREDLADREEDARERIVDAFKVALNSLSAATVGRAAVVSAMTLSADSLKEEDVEDVPNSPSAPLVLHTSELPEMEEVVVPPSLAPGEVVAVEAAATEAEPPEDGQLALRLGALMEMQDYAFDQLAKDAHEESVVLAQHALLDRERISRAAILSEDGVFWEATLNSAATSAMHAAKVEALIRDEESARLAVQQTQAAKREELATGENTQQQLAVSSQALREAAVRERAEEQAAMENAQLAALNALYDQRLKDVVDMEGKMRAIIDRTHDDILLELQTKIVQFHETFLRNALEANEEVVRADHTIRQLNERGFRQQSLSTSTMDGVITPLTAHDDEEPMTEEKITSRSKPPTLQPEQLIPLRDYQFQFMGIMPLLSSPVTTQSACDSPKEVHNTVLPHSPIIRQLVSLDSNSVHNYHNTNDALQALYEVQQQQQQQHSVPGPTRAHPSDTSGPVVIHVPGNPPDVPSAGESPPMQCVERQPTSTAGGPEDLAEDVVRGASASATPLQTAHETDTSAAQTVPAEPKADGAPEVDGREAAAAEQEERPASQGSQRQSQRPRRPRGRVHGYDVAAIADDEAGEITASGLRVTADDGDNAAEGTRREADRGQQALHSTTQAVKELVADDVSDKPSGSATPADSQRASEQLRMHEGDSYPYIFSNAYNERLALAAAQARQEVEASNNSTKSSVSGPRSSFSRPPLAERNTPPSAERGIRTPFLPLMLNHNENDFHDNDEARALREKMRKESAEGTDHFWSETVSSESRSRASAVAQPMATTSAQLSTLGMPVLRRHDHFMRNGEDDGAVAGRANGTREKFIPDNQQQLVEPTLISEPGEDSRASFNSAAESDMRRAARDELLMSGSPPYSRRDTPSTRDNCLPLKSPSLTPGSSLAGTVSLLKGRHLPVASSGGGSSIERTSFSAPHGVWPNAATLQHSKTGHPIEVKDRWVPPSAVDNDDVEEAIADDVDIGESNAVGEGEAAAVYDGSRDTTNAAAQRDHEQERTLDGPMTLEAPGPSTHHEQERRGKGYDAVKPLTIVIDPDPEAHVSPGSEGSPRPLTPPFVRATAFKPSAASPDVPSATPEHGDSGGGGADDTRNSADGCRADDDSVAAGVVPVNSGSYEGKPEDEGDVRGRATARAQRSLSSKSSSTTTATDENRQGHSHRGVADTQAVLFTSRLVDVHSTSLDSDELLDAPIQQSVPLDLV